MRGIVLAPLAILAVACAESTGSIGNPISIAGNQIVENRHDRDITTAYEFTPRGGAVFAGLLEVVEGSLVLEIYDAGGTNRLASVRSARPGDALGAHGTLPITVVAGQSVQLRVSGGGRYRVEAFVKDPAPETGRDTISVGDTVRSVIEADVDVDEFHFLAAPGEELIGYLKAESGPSFGTLALYVQDERGSLISVAVSSSGLNPFERDNTGRFVLPPSRSYLARVSPPPSAPFHVGPYTFQLRRVIRAPEQSPVALPIRDTVNTEALDYVGDIDQFELRGAPGGEFSIAFRTLADSSTMMLRLDSAAADNGFPPQIDGVPGDSLFDRSTGRFQLPASGVTSLTVYSVDAVHGRGRYQIAAFPVDHRPERAAPTIAIGDSITNEAIDFPGDVDEYQFQTAANDTVFLTLAIDSAAAARLTGLNLILQSLSEVSNKKTPSPQAPGPGVTVGPLVLNPGTHTVSFYAQFDRTKGYVGPYRFSLSRHP